MIAERRNELKNTGYEIFIAILSVLSIVNIVLMYAVDDDNLDTVILAMNGLLSGIFLGDFAYRLLTADSKSGYFVRQFGWADLLASLPFPQVKVLRLFRLIRVVRLLRMNGVRRILRTLLEDRAGSALLTLVMMGILVLEFGSLGILHIEQYQEGANITTASDALWYVMVTISTVGYGDRFPVTNDGRLVGTLIIVIGVGIFGTFTGYLANLFLAPKKSKREATADIDAAQAQVDRLRELMAEQQSSIDDIETAPAPRPLTRIGSPISSTADQVASAAMASNRWVELIEENPEHSSWYVERFRSMASAGDDLDGEARFVDAMLARRSRVLDAGCGPGRVGGHLARMGHDVVGVDFDPVLISAAEEDHPGPTWLVADLAELDLPAMGIEDGFDVVVCAGNVMTFLAPETRRPVLGRLAAHLRPGGRLVIGFGAGVSIPSTNSSTTSTRWVWWPTCCCRRGISGRSSPSPTSWWQ